MERVAKSFPPSTDMIHKLHLLIQLLTNSKHFRKNLPEALSLISQCLDASHALLLEVAPIHLEASQLIFEHILHVPPLGEARKHAIPDQLADIHFTSSTLVAWLRKLKTFSRERPPGETANNETNSNEIIHGTFELVKKVSKDIDLAALLEGMEITATSFTLFPLLRKEKTFGFLLFFSSKEVNLWDEKAIDLAYSGASLITNLLEQQYAEKRQTEIVFKKNQSRYSSIIKDTKMGLWDWQLKPQKIQVNETFLKILGLKEKKLAFSQADILALIHPDELSVLRNAIVHHINQKTDNYQTTARFKTGTGEWKWFQIYGRLVEETTAGAPKRMSGILLDVHQQKMTAILLQEGEALLKAVMDAMPDTKLHVKLDGTIIAVYRSSQKKEEQIYFPQKIAGRKLQEVMPVFTARGLLFNTAEAIRTKSLQTFEYITVIEDVTHYFEARVNQVNEEEAIIILRDITSVKKIEKDLNEQIYKHDQNVRELKKYIDSNLQLENFAYIASHDLREPLRTMRMFGQFLQKNIGNKLDRENLSYLDFIIDGAKRMNELIEGILTYSRVDTDPLDKEVIVTEDLIADSIDNLSKAIEKQKAVVVVEGVPSRIYGSKIRLEQVFQNLIANGIKFSKPDVSPRIVIAGQETTTHWIFKVSDNGIGIKKEFFNQIFVLFKKLHNNKDFEGAGIGLALLKRIVEQHEGKIWLESDEDVGTTFLFSLRKEQMEDD